MGVSVKGSEIDRSALMIVDMQNDFLHQEGSFGHTAREHPEFRRGGRGAAALHRSRGWWCATCAKAGTN